MIIFPLPIMTLPEELRKKSLEGVIVRFLCTFIDMEITFKIAIVLPFGQRWNQLGFSRLDKQKKKKKGLLCPPVDRPFYRQLIGFYDNSRQQHTSTTVPQ